jgi:hypothetical protein
MATGIVKFFKAEKGWDLLSRTSLKTTCSCTSATFPDSSRYNRECALATTVIKTSALAEPKP